MSGPARIERIKLAAAALNTLATSAITVGMLAPAAAFLYGIGSPAIAGWQLALSALLWTSLAGALHSAAQRLLGRLT